MTGEMSWIKPNGEAGDGNTYETHAFVARKLRAKLRPFDTYIGPYVDTKYGKLFITSDDGISGAVCLWVGGIAPAYHKPITGEYFPFDMPEAALDCARMVLKTARNPRYRK
jgi:hypothetical protein